MKTILVDMAKVDEFVHSYVMKDSTKILNTELMKYYHKVFDFHKTNKKEFLESFDFYLSNPAYAKDMFDSIAVESRRVKEQINKIPIDTSKLAPKNL